MNRVDLPFLLMFKLVVRFTITCKKQKSTQTILILSFLHISISFSYSLSVYFIFIDGYLVVWLCSRAE
jgi:hypothetical protein